MAARRARTELTAVRLRCAQRVVVCGGAALAPRSNPGEVRSHFSMATQLSQQSEEKMATRGISGPRFPGSLDHAGTATAEAKTRATAISLGNQRSIPDSLRD